MQQEQQGAEAWQGEPGREAAAEHREEQGGGQREHRAAAHTQDAGTHPPK